MDGEDRGMGKWPNIIYHLTHAMKSFGFANRVKPLFFSPINRDLGKLRRLPVLRNTKSLSYRLRVA